MQAIRRKLRSCIEVGSSCQRVDGTGFAIDDAEARDDIRWVGFGMVLENGDDETILDGMDSKVGESVEIAF